MEEMNNQDTPQTANSTGMDDFGSPVLNEGSDNSNLSVEDAFFTKADIDNSTAPSEGQPVETDGNINSEEPYEARNDDKRYEYWQSQAAKKDNEMRAMQEEMQRVAALQQQQQQPTQQAPQQTEQFPPPPPKPEKPHGFSREEAWSDSSSESAKYLDDVDRWSEDMGNYRDLRNQYELAVVKENLQARDDVVRKQQVQRAQYAQTQREKQEIYEHVQGHYGLNPDDARDFINSMSDPRSISMDNLVQLYRLNKGGGEQSNTPAAGPSAAFQQSRNAQQVPSPMGVMPGQSPESNRNESDTIMDELINTHNSKNPWN